MIADINSFWDAGSESLYRHVRPICNIVYRIELYCGRGKWVQYEFEDASSRVILAITRIF